MIGALPIPRSGGFGLPCAAGALKPPSPRRALPSNRAGMNRPVGSVPVVSDGGPVPHSRRPRGASVAHGGSPRLGVSSRDDCRGLRAPAFSNSHRPGRALPSALGGERDGRAPVPTGCAIVASLPAAALGSPAVGRLFYPRFRLYRQVPSGRAPVCVPASSSHLPHPTRSVASIFLKHGGLTECGQSRGRAAR